MPFCCIGGSRKCHFLYGGSQKQAKFLPPSLFLNGIYFIYANLDGVETVVHPVPDSQEQCMHENTKLASIQQCFRLKLTFMYGRESNPAWITEYKSGGVLDESPRRQEGGQPKQDRSGQGEGNKTVRKPFMNDLVQVVYYGVHIYIYTRLTRLL